MKKSRSPRKTKAAHSVGQLLLHLDAESMDCLEQAARLRHISVGDYVKTVAVAQARRELEAACIPTIALTPAEQLAFWKALNQTPKLTRSQRALGRIMRDLPSL
jgi:uncharacterized protein (DUF1778 family)